MIEKLNLKTPGREDDDSEQAIDLNANASVVKKELKAKQSGSASGSPDPADPLAAGRIIVNALGGKDNIPVSYTHLAHCNTYAEQDA